jgi:hypothetical protein
MSKLKVAFLDKRLIMHLELNGELAGDTGKQLITKIVKSSCSEAAHAATMSQFGFSMEEICYMYISMVANLMPNPCIKTGTRMLAASLPMMESDKFLALLSHVNSRLKSAEHSDRREVIFTSSGEFAQDVWEAHRQARGEAAFSVKPGNGLSQSGCATMLALATVFPAGALAGR